MQPWHLPRTHTPGPSTWLPEKALTRVVDASHLLTPSRQGPGRLDRPKVTRGYLVVTPELAHLPVDTMFLPGPEPPGPPISTSPHPITSSSYVFPLLTTNGACNLPGLPSPTTNKATGTSRLYRKPFSSRLSSRPSIRLIPTVGPRRRSTLFNRNHARPHQFGRLIPGTPPS